jgi:hypothetical protein
MFLAFLFLFTTVKFYIHAIYLWTSIYKISTSTTLHYDIVEHLARTNFPCWKNAMELCLGFNKFDYALRKDKPKPPIDGDLWY